MKSSDLLLFTCAGLLLVCLFVLNCKKRAVTTDQIHHSDEEKNQEKTFNKSDHKRTLSGAAVLGTSTSWMLLRISYYFWTTDLGTELGSSMLFIAGAVLCLPVCWLATLVPYHARSLPLLATLMLCLTAALVLFSAGMCSAVGLSRAVRETSTVNASMHRALYLDAVDPNVKSALAAMQLELKCCGVQSHTDWYQHRRVLPPACCGRVRNLKDDHCHSPLHHSGCLPPALQELRIYTNSLTALGCAIIVILAVTLFVTAFILVTNVIERPKYQSMRIACIAPPTTYPNAPPVSI